MFNQETIIIRSRSKISITEHCPLSDRVRFMIENARDIQESMGIASVFPIRMRLMAGRLFHCVGKCLADLRFDLFAKLEIVGQEVLDCLATLSELAVTVAEP